MNLQVPAKLRPIAQTALSGEWPFSEIEFTEARASQTSELQYLGPNLLHVEQTRLKMMGLGFRDIQVTRGQAMTVQIARMRLWGRACTARAVDILISWMPRTYRSMPAT